MNCRWVKFVNTFFCWRFEVARSNFQPTLEIPIYIQLCLFRKWILIFIQKNLYRYRRLPQQEQKKNMKKDLKQAANLLFIFFIIIFSNRVELQSVLVLFNSNKSNPISNLVLLQVSLCQILQVFSTKLGVGNNNNLVTFWSDGNFITQVTNNIVNFNVFNKVLDVTFLVKNTVFNWSWGVNGEFLGWFGFLGGLKKKGLEG